MSATHNHTPGRWTALPVLDANHGHAIRADRGYCIATAHRLEVPTFPDSECVCNANLLAASPMLYDAVEAARNFLLDGTPDGDRSPAEQTLLRTLYEALAEVRPLNDSERSHFSAV
ncbi:MAG: hypothetical protein ACREKF_14510, partial [Candidatus Methylomirabilales bacterium]